MRDVNNTTVALIADAVDVILSRHPASAAEATRLQRAIQVDSPMIASRFRLLVENSEHAKYTAEEQQIIADAVAALSGNPSRDQVIRLRVTQEEKAEITAAAEDAGQTISEYVRQRLL